MRTRTRISEDGFRKVHQAVEHVLTPSPVFEGTTMAFYGRVGEVCGYTSHTVGLVVRALVSLNIISRVETRTPSGVVGDRRIYFRFRLEKPGVDIGLVNGFYQVVGRKSR